MKNEDVIPASFAFVIKLIMNLPQFLQNSIEVKYISQILKKQERHM